MLAKLAKLADVQTVLFLRCRIREALGSCSLSGEPEPVACSGPEPKEELQKEITSKFHQKPKGTGVDLRLRPDPKHGAWASIINLRHMAT